MSNIDQLSQLAAFLFIEPEKRTLVEPDFEPTVTNYGIGTIVGEKSLYLRTMRLLLWRMDAINTGKKPDEIRRIEGNVKWPHGRALPPASKDNPLGIPSYFTEGYDEAAQEHVQYFVNDNLYRNRNNQEDWVRARLMRALGLNEKDSKKYKDTFSNNPNEPLSQLNSFLDNLAKENAFFEIDSKFVGMAPVKKAIWKLYRSDRFSAQESLSKASLSMHMAFVGTRGKGKTTVVPAVAYALKNLGLIERDSVKTISLNDIAGDTLGSDDVKLRKAFEEGKGGIVFVDEADVIADYLARGHSRSQLSQGINQRMEELRQSTCVIVATYPEHIDNFLNSDPGLRSRFGDRVIHFADYSTEDLVRMFEIEINQTSFRVESDHVRSTLWEHFSDMRKNNHKDFADGRSVREFIQSLQAVLQDRLSEAGESGIYRTPTHKQTRDITVTDIENTIKSIKNAGKAADIKPYAEINPFQLKVGKPDAAPVANDSGSVVVQLKSARPSTLNNDR